MENWAPATRLHQTPAAGLGRVLANYHLVKIFVRSFDGNNIYALNQTPETLSCYETMPLDIAGPIEYSWCIVNNCCCRLSRGLANIKWFSPTGNHRVVDLIERGCLHSISNCFALLVAVIVMLCFPSLVLSSAVKRSIGSTTGFHNHGEGPY